MIEPAIEIEGLSKRYRGGGPLVPLPYRWTKRLERGQRHGSADDEVIDDDMDDGSDIDDDLDDVDDMDDSVGEEFDDQLSPQPPISDESWALRDLWLTISPGSRVALIGPDGSGKTTLLRILARTAIPTLGRAIVRGRMAPPIQLLPGLMQSTVSGRNNVPHIANYLGIGRREALSHVDEIADFAELTNNIDKRIRTYSSNERLRFAFSLALGLDPQVMLADGVVAVGDPEFRQRCIQEIERRTALGMTLLVATPSMDLVRRLCTDAILLDSGRLVEYGPVNEVIRSYESRMTGPAQAAGLALPRNGAQESVPVRLTGGLYSVTGHPVKVLAVDDEALIELVLDVDEAPVTLRCVLGLAGPHGIVRVSQPFKFVVENPGRCHVSVRVPPESLTPGLFRTRVTVMGFTEHGRGIAARAPEAFSFEVMTPRGTDPAAYDELTSASGNQHPSWAWHVSHT